MGASITDYPDGENTAGPHIARLVRLPLDYDAEIYRNEDGSVFVNVQPCGLMKWQIDYDGLSAADVITLRTHYNLAKSQVNYFNFWDRQQAALIPDVQYESFRVGHRVVNWLNVVSVVLVHYE